MQNALSPTMIYSQETLKALVIEDNEGDFVIMEELLADEISKPLVTRAETMAEAVSLLRGTADYEVVLLDLSLPDGEGELLVRQIVEEARQIPVIVFTGYTDKSFGIKTLSWGVSDYLLKDDLKSFQLYKSISYSIERKKVHNQLSESELKYRALFNLSPIPKWVFELETLQFLQVNEAAIRHYGYTREGFLSMTLADIYPREDIPSLEKAISQIQQQSDRHFKGTVRHRKKNGEVIFVEIESSEILYEGVIARIVLANDVTDKLIAEQKLKKSEEQLRLLNAELEQRVAERTSDLTEASKQLEIFSYSISHDLQSPLRSMMGFAQIIKRKHSEKLTEEGSMYIDHIITSARKMSDLIINLLEFSRIGKKSVQKHVIRTNALVRSVWDNLPKENPEKIEYIQNELPDILGDASLIEQVFVNLLSNAIKYSSKKEYQRIEVGARSNEAEVIFYVKDNGSGFDMAYYEKLFGLFKRLHTPSEFEGTGVGLSIVKTIVKKHGGEIWAESQLGEGSAFSFTLPAAPLPEPTHSPNSPGNQRLSAGM